MRRENAPPSAGAGDPPRSAPPGEAGRGGTRIAAEALLRLAAAGEEPIAGPHLVVLCGPAAGARLALAAEQVLGRGHGADLRIADPTASRRHARVRVASGDATVEDLGSKNGIAVNGRRLRGSRRLAPGDEIALGATTLAFTDPLAGATLPGPPPVSPPAPAGAARPGLAWAAAALLLGLCAAALALAA
jgi:S-DNA-T family DNA segregation ATPase FtsK/SpoIIIE